MTSTNWSKLPFALSVAVGMALALVLLAIGQLGASGSGDEVVDEAALFVNDEGVAQMRSDLDRTIEIADAQTGGLSRLASVSGLDEQRFVTELTRRNPGFGPSLDRLPADLELTEAVIGNLENRVDQFESADSLPGAGLSLKQGTIGQLGFACLLILIGVAGLRHPSRPLAACVAALGIATIAAPLILGLPSKASDADEVLDSLRPFSIEKVEARQQVLADGQTLFAAFEADAIPLAAELSGGSADAVRDQLAATDPNLTQASLAELEPILDRFGVLVDFSARIQPKLQDADTISARQAMWLMLSVGIILLAGSAAGFAGARRRTAR